MMFVWARVLLLTFFVEKHVIDKQLYMKRAGICNGMLMSSLMLFGPVMPILILLVMLQLTTMLPY